MVYTFDVIVKGKIIDKEEIITKDGRKINKYYLRNAKRYLLDFTSKSQYEIGQEIERVMRLVLYLTREGSRFYIVDLEEE